MELGAGVCQLVDKVEVAPVRLVGVAVGVFDEPAAMLLSERRLLG
jgi:hypothetical protein